MGTHFAWNSNTTVCSSHCTIVPAGHLLLCFCWVSWSTHFARNSCTVVYSSLCTLVHGQKCGLLTLDKPAGVPRVPLFWPMRAQADSSVSTNHRLKNWLRTEDGGWRTEKVTYRALSSCRSQKLAFDKTKIHCNITISQSSSNSTNTGSLPEEITRWKGCHSEPNVYN